VPHDGRCGGGNHVLGLPAQERVDERELPAVPEAAGDGQPFRDRFPPGATDPFLFLTPIQPTKHLVSTCFRLLTNWHPGGIFPKTLAINLGALQSAYSYAKDGYRIHKVAINDVNNLGKHLNKEKGQDESVNRAILDILDRLASLEGQGDDEMELIARQCNVIRGNYFDKRRKMEDAIPQVLLVKSDYLVKEVLPTSVFEE